MSPGQGTPSPLRPEDLEHLNAALQMLNVADDLITRYAACGENCQSHADTSRHIRSKLEAIKRQFGSGQ